MPRDPEGRAVTESNKVTLPQIQRDTVVCGITYISQSSQVPDTRHLTTPHTITGGEGTYHKPEISLKDEVRQAPKDAKEGEL